MVISKDVGKIMGQFLRSYLRRMLTSIHHRIGLILYPAGCNWSPDGRLHAMIREIGVQRALWLISYIEETQGGHRSLIHKVPLDGNGYPIPWYTYPAIEFLSQFNFTACSVFEYGSGNSSKFWSARSAAVTSVEWDEDWYNFGKSSQPENHILLLRTEKEHYVSAIGETDSFFNVIVVDGNYRYDCVKASICKLTEGGIIILDNSDWFPNTCRHLRDQGFTQIDFIGAGPLNSYAWATSIFFIGGILIPRKVSSGPVPVLSGISEISYHDQPNS